MVRSLVVGTELAPVPVRLLEVEPDELVGVGHARAGREPVGEALVQHGAFLFGEHLIRGVRE